MHSYQIKSSLGSQVIARNDGAFIPFDMANMDTRQFIADWQAGATVTDKDGTPQAYSEAALAALGLSPVG